MKLILTLLISIVLALSTRAQSYKAVYNYKFIPDSSNMQDVKSVRAVLRIGEISSLFSTEANLKRDSITHLVRNGELPLYRAMREMRQLYAIDKVSFIVSKSFETKEVTFHDKIATQKFKYSDNAIFNWEIGNSRRDILGYNCQSAKLKFGGRNYVAWFTDEIPIPDGPFVFQGLPGLIVSIRDTKYHHNFELKSFMARGANVNEDNPYDNELYIQTTKEKFLRSKKDYFDNPDAFMEGTGAIVVSENAPKINPWRGVIRNSIIIEEY
jgi:GLPGLI family protein